MCLEAISHPAGGWWRKQPAEVNTEVEPKNKNIIPSPDSVNVRTNSGKADNNVRYSPAP